MMEDQLGRTAAYFATNSSSIVQDLHRAASPEKQFQTSENSTFRLHCRTSARGVVPSKSITTNMNDYALFSDIINTYKECQEGWRRYSLKGLREVHTAEVSIGKLITIICVLLV